jgi:hypothetical protein
MRFTKGDPASFFDSRVAPSDLLAERSSFLEGDPDLYTALAPEGEELLDETIALAHSLETLPDFNFTSLAPLQKCHALGKLWEADFLLMKPDAEGTFRMFGGCVCFPSHWDLSEKMGRSMLSIHQPVPGLNEALGRQINGFLAKIKPGISWERGNWGLSASPERNLHPSLNRPHLHRSIELEQVWWRLEEQSLVSLPESGGILFGIKLDIRPLSEIRNDPDGRAGLIRALQTMSPEMAVYKGIEPGRGRLLELLEA